MTVTDRMQNDGMSFKDARMKESLTVGDAPDEAVAKKYAYALDIAKLWRAGKMIGGDEDEIRDTLLDYIEAQDKRFAEHLAAWKANNAAHAARIAELEGALGNAINLIDGEVFNTGGLKCILGRK